jgi:WD40 repeat protein
MLKRRALNIFRDKTSLTANPALWPSLEESLSSSQYFILIASPASSGSPWVRKEVSWWLTNRSPRQFLIILAEGDLAWDEQQHDFDWSRTSALLAIPNTSFEAEPLYVDLRWAKTSVELSLRNSKFREAVLPLAAKLHGVEPQDLDGEDLKQFRRTRRFWRTAVLGLIALTLTSIIAAVIAKLKSDEAIEQAKIALSQKLAVDSTRQQDADIDLALLLAREAYLIRPTKEARTSLLSALLRGKQRRFERSGSHAFEVSALSSSSDWEPVDGKKPELPASLRNVGEIGCVTQGPDGKFLAVGTKTSNTTAYRFSADLVIWNLEKNEPLWPPIRKHLTRITALRFAPDGKSLVSADTHGTVYRWNLASREPEGERLDGHKTEVREIQFEDSGRMLVTKSIDGDVIQWDLSNQQRIARILDENIARQSSEQGFTRVAFARGGRSLIAALPDGSVAAWELSETNATSKTLMTAIGAGSPSLAVSLDGSKVAVALAGKIRVFNLDNGEVARIEADSRLRCLAFSADGRTLAFGGDGTLRFWAFEHSQESRDMSTALGDNKGRVYSVAFSEDGKTFFAASGHNVLAWSVKADNLDGSPRVFTADGQITRIALTSDGQILAAGNWEGTVFLWSVATQIPLGRPLLGHQGTIIGLAFHPDGSILASSEANGSAILWDMLQRQRIGGQLVPGGYDMTDLAFSPDGKTLAAGSDNRVVTVWDLDVSTWLSQACLVANRNLTADEWTRYLPNRPYRARCPEH